jgi:23S rRNA (adenine2503-C2)-methyltransferase
MMPDSVSGLSKEQLADLVLAMGEPAYRARQIHNRLFRGLAASFEEMTDLPSDFRKKMVEEVRLRSLVVVDEVTGPDGTVKDLFELEDKATIESALMSYPRDRGGQRHTACISTQVGCPVGCPFCATGQQGFERNLTTGEIVDQVLYLARYLREQSARDDDGNPERKVNNIVFMGMGEPLANFEALWRAIEILNSPDGFGLGARSMTISTSGLVPQIESLSREKLQVGLAVSLHAGENRLRNRLVPINRKYPLEQLIPACRKYVRTSGQRLSFEYVLFKNINDTPEDARRMAGLLKGMSCHVNVFPANETGDPAFRSPEPAVIDAFYLELKRLHVNVSLRKRRGQDIGAGCGQLRSRVLEAGGSSRPEAREKRNIN